MPGIENFAPERTETSSGFSRRAQLRAGGGLELLQIRQHLLLDRRRQLGCSRNRSCRPSVAIVNPGGTGRPALVISASPAPLPPSRSFIVRLPSALPFPKK